MSRRLQAALFLLIAVQAGGLVAQDMVAPETYRVQIIAQPGQDVSAVAKAVAAAYGGRLEAPVAADDTVAMSLDASVLALVGRDARVQRIDTVDELRPAIPQPAVQNRANPAVAASRRPQTEGTITTPWTTGTYAYDAAGNITEIGTADRFTYDVYSRIKSGTAAGQSQEYAYDRWGNLTSIKTGVTTIPLTVDTATNRLTSVNGSSISYDAAGQVLQVQSAASYTYDGIGMMTSSGTLGVPSNLYLYTASDERIASVFVSGGSEVSSAWTFRDASGKMLRRFDRQNGSGQWNWVWREDYIYNGSQMLASENDSAPKTRHFFTDHLGTPRLIIDSGGMQIGLAAYLPFGAQASVSGLTDAKRFTGHERDPSGLDYMHARYYNLGWGRFLSVDPVLDVKRHLQKPQGWNRYTYVENNPINNTDPTGRCTLESGWFLPCVQVLQAVTEAVWEGFYNTAANSGIGKIYRGAQSGDTRLAWEGQVQLDHEILTGMMVTSMMPSEGSQTVSTTEQGEAWAAPTPTFYRGGGSLTVTSKDVKVVNGLVQPTRGVSVSTNPAGMQRFGGASRVGSVPSELSIVQIGKNPNHFEIVPKAAMPLSTFQELLDKIKLDKVN